VETKGWQGEQRTRYDHDGKKLTHSSSSTTVLKPTDFKIIT
jgi:hypothetical protein